MIIAHKITEPVINLKDQYFDLKGLSVYSALAVSTLRGHIEKSGMPAYKVGGKVIIKKSEFDRWISNYRINQNRDLDTICNEVMASLKE